MVVTGSAVVDNGIGGAEDDAVPDVVYGVVESGLGLLVCFVVASAAHVQLFSPPR